MPTPPQLPYTDTVSGLDIVTITQADGVMRWTTVGDMPGGGGGGDLGYTPVNRAGDTMTGSLAMSGTGYLQAPSGTTGQRPGSPANGMIRYNSTTNRVEVYDNGTWRNLARLDGDTFSGAVGFSAAGTAVDITNNARTRGVHTFGGDSGNRLIITPGAAGANAIALTQSGSGGITFPGNFTVQGGNTIAATGGGGSITLTNGLTTTPRLTAGSNISPSSAAISPAITGSVGSLGGTVVGSADVYKLVISNDTANGDGAANGVIDTVGIYHNVGAGTGGRANIWAQLNSGNHGVNGRIMMSGSFTVFCNNTDGSEPFIQPFVAAATVTANSTAGSILNEIDYMALTGSAVGTKGGLLIALATGDKVRGSSQDAGLIFTNANRQGDGSPGMQHAIQFGNDGHGFPVSNSDGKLISVYPQTAWKNAGRSGRFIPVRCQFGLDFGPVNFSKSSGYFLRGPGLTADGTGQISVINATITKTAGGVALDVARKIVTSVAINTPGSSAGDGVNCYYAGDIITGLSTSDYPGQYEVTHTQVIAAQVLAGGSGGTNGTQTVTGTTGTGTKFQASVTITGGAITAVLSITVAGDYTVNPANVADEPVTGASLTGARLKLGVGVLTAAVLVGDVDETGPATIATSGGSGAGCVLTPTWGSNFDLEVQPSGGAIGFFGATPVTRPTGVDVSAAGVHAALVSLGLIAA